MWVESTGERSGVSKECFGWHSGMSKSFGVYMHGGILGLSNITDQRPRWNSCNVAWLLTSAICLSLQSIITEESQPNPLMRKKVHSMNSFCLILHAQLIERSRVLRA